MSKILDNKFGSVDNYLLYLYSLMITEVINKKDIMTKTKERTPITILPRNWNRMLIDACDGKVTQTTVTRAIRYNAEGKKADMVRAKYKELFGDNNYNQ